MTQYEYKGRLPKGTTAKDVAVTVNALVKKHGDARPEHLVAVARAKTHPLHGCFTWDDSEAAKLHRLSEARYVLRSIVIVREERPDVTIRAFVNTEREGAYSPIATVLADPDARSKLLAQALADLQAFSRKYDALEELEPVREAIKEVERAAEAAAAQVAA